MSDVLQFGRPEEAGVRPEWVEDYVNELNRRGKMCHSFLMLRDGRVFAEGYWKPFHKDWLHRMYSVSKSFVSAAVGMLIDDGRLRLTDKIVDYFPEQRPVHPRIEEMTIRDMLMMATCHKCSTYNGTDMDWLHTFFHPHFEPDHPAGTEFRYDTSATYTLDVLVERLTGKTFLEFLKDRMLRELGFSENAWCVEAPEGCGWGGSGVECTTRDLARFALVFLNGGVVNGKQYLSPSYVAEATARQIDNVENGLIDKIHGNGYGYQIWRTAGNGFAFLGMGGQLAVCLPDRDFLFACTSDVQGDADGYVPICDVLWETVLNRMEDAPLPADDAALEHMRALLDSLEVVVPVGAKTSPLAEHINGKTWDLEDNPMGIHSLELRFDGSGGQVTYHTLRGDKAFPFGLGAYTDTVFPETHYSGRRINQPLGHGYRCLNAAVWQAEKRLLVRTYVIDDYFGNMAAVFTFDGDQIQLSMTKTAEWFLEEYCGEADGVLRK